MHFRRLLYLQLFYAILGLLFNLISWWLVSDSGKGLTPTDPKGGIIAMLVYAAFLIPGKMNRLTLYRGLMLLAVLIFGYSGIIKHILTLAQSPEVYYSLAVGVLAI
ncbi:MAG: hypothetical protein AAF693_22750, partial [Bacteroidota bacterium]